MPDGDSDWPLIWRPQDLAEPLREGVLQSQAEHALNDLGFVVHHLSQVQAALMALGIPDDYVYQPKRPIGAAWLEWKRPLIRRPGVRPGTWVQAQPQGYRSYEQEQRYHEWTAAGIRVATVDSVELALAFLAHCGYDVPRDAYKAPFDPADQVRFYNPRAKPRSTIRAEARLRAKGVRVARPRRRPR